MLAQNITSNTSITIFYTDTSGVLLHALSLATSDILEPWIVLLSLGWDPGPIYHFVYKIYLPYVKASYSSDRLVPRLNILKYYSYNIVQEPVYSSDCQSILSKPKNM